MKMKPYVRGSLYNWYSTLKIKLLSLITYKWSGITGEILVTPKPHSSGSPNKFLLPLDALTLAPSHLIYAVFLLHFMHFIDFFWILSFTSDFDAHHCNCLQNSRFSSMCRIMSTVQSKENGTWWVIGIKKFLRNSVTLIKLCPWYFFPKSLKI